MPIDIVEWRKQYYAKNREKLLAASKEYYAKNKDKCKATASATHLKKIEEDPKYYNKISSKHYYKSKEYYKEYYKKNRSTIIARQNAYYYNIKFNKTEAEKPPYYKASTVAIKQAFIESQLADLLVKKEAFKKKLAEEAATAAEKNSGLNPLP